MGDTLTAVELLEKGVLRAEQLQGQPIVQAELLHTMGRIYQSLGNENKAILLIERALKIQNDNLGVEHPDVSLCLNNLGLIMFRKGDYESAKIFFEESLSIRKKYWEITILKLHLL